MFSSSVSSLTASSSAIDYLLQTYQNSATLYVYFDYKEGQRHTAIRVLRSLFKQLVAQLEALPHAVIKLYDDCLKRAVGPDLGTLLRHFISLFAEFDSVFILFDAFDECEDPHGHILRLLQDFITQPAVRVLVSGRLQVIQRLQDFSASYCIFNIYADCDDIQTYLTSALKNQRYITPDLKNEIVEVISQRAEGM